MQHLLIPYYLKYFPRWTSMVTRQDLANQFSDEILPEVGQYYYIVAWTIIDLES
jgi:hypothetical protein